MELDTPLRPRAVAEAVWEEASVWLEQPLPRRWLRELIAEANRVYANNARVRRKMRSNGKPMDSIRWEVFAETLQVECDVILNLRNESVINATCCGASSGTLTSPKPASSSYQ